MRRRKYLDGIWERSVNGRPFMPQPVPYSALCVGEATLRTVFSSEKAERAILCFEGITYRAEVTLNGEPLGEMLPYCRYQFEVGALLKENPNTLTVRLEDRGMKYGPAEGWENYGGVIRSVYLEYTDTVRVEDVFWHCALSDDLRRAACCAEVKAHGAAVVRLTLLDAFGDPIASRGEPVTDDGAQVRFFVEKPQLWSPESPARYLLRVEAVDENGLVRDSLEQRVGIREFCARGRQFLLNGRPYFLKGVCRHDMWAEQGHTLTDGQIRRDLAMMKAAGCNFVRLVHYPHDARVLEIADEIGLLMCEESGLWWSDVTDPEVYQPALRVMEKTILRDRNHPCIAFWLSFNECVFTEVFLKAAADVCRRLDPYRMVSGANCMNPAKTKEIFTAAGFDFYSFHPYGPDETTIMGGIDASRPYQSLEDVYNTLDDKPLLFTEWGGCHVEDNAFTFTRFLKNLLKAGREGRLAGFSYWVWADMYEFGRGEPGCFNGILREGMVDIRRKPHAILDVFTRLLGDPSALEEAAPQMRLLPFSVPRGSGVPLPLPRNADAQNAAWKQMMEMCAIQQGFRNKPTRRMLHGPALPAEVRRIGDLPVLLNEGRPLVILDTLEIPLSVRADALYVLGNVVLPWGWPQYGGRGEDAGSYTIVYTDGTRQEIPLRNGMEATGAIALAGPSRLDPWATNAEQAICFAYDLNWERYVVQAMALPLAPRPAEKLIIRCGREDSALLLYGITAWQKEKPENEWARESRSPEMEEGI